MSVESRKLIRYHGGSVVRGRAIWEMSDERTRVGKLFDRYPDQPVTKDGLMDRFVDLHRVLKDAFVLPVEGYGLKPVSKWLGFKYRNPKSSATQSMLWYRLWFGYGESAVSGRQRVVQRG